MQNDSTHCLTRDHPRVCGEKPSRHVLLVFREGSPPRVRGKENRQRALARVTGITPACAGKSPQYEHFQTSVQDHPRVCGEKLIDDTRTRERLGSPPRVRGKDE